MRACPTTCVDAARALVASAARVCARSGVDGEVRSVEQTVALKWALIFVGRIWQICLGPTQKSIHKATRCHTHRETYADTEHDATSD